MILDDGSEAYDQTAPHTRYLKETWGGLRSFLDYYVALDRRVRSTVSRQNDAPSDTTATQPRDDVRFDDETKDVSSPSTSRFALMLADTFPEHCISAGGHKGDFVLSRRNQPTMLLGLKAWEDGHTTNLKSRDVTRFERDVQNNCRHGIMVVMGSGVVDRRDFEFKVMDDRYVALFLTSVHWDMTRVRAAVSVICCLDEMLQVADRDGVVAFPQNVVDSLNTDVQLFDKRLQESIAQLDAVRDNLQTIMLDGIRTRLATGRTSVNPPRITDKVVAGQCSFCRQIRSSWNDHSNLNAHIKTCMAKVMQDKQREYDLEESRNREIP